MTKQELVANIATELGMKKTEVARILDELMGIIKANVVSNNSVTLRNFGTFQQITRNARNFHYAPGMYKLIPKHNEPMFKPSYAFKSLIN